MHALAERTACEITWPRLLGYRYELPSERLSAKFTGDAKFTVTNADIPTKTEVEGIVGEIRVSHVAGDSGWEFKLVQELEDMPEVFSYVKNQSLGFTIPYTVNGVERQYYPDFLIRLDDGRGRDGSAHPDRRSDG